MTRMTQWHPIFAQLLRPAVEAYYEVQTTVPVGDAPREADFVLLRRTRSAAPPFRGLWRHLTSWNILEFKGPSVTPRRGDIDLLVELGLGIDRRFRVRGPRPSRRLVLREEVSFWYLANHLGQRFLQDAAAALGSMESLGPGLWRSRALGRLVLLVSSVDLPVEVDSVPLHLVGNEPRATELEVARLVLERPELQQRYAGWVASLHPAAWKEVEAMARAAGKGLQIDLRPAIESLGLKFVLEQVGIRRVIEVVGIERVLDEMGDKEVAKRMGLERFLATLTAAERRELKRRL
jgi:hypothetical protein